VTYAWNHNALVIASAGNDASSAPAYPAANAYAIGVGATNPSGAWASFSNYGSWVLATAPGEGILSTTPTYPTTDFPGPDPASAYNYGDGTSFAAPIVAATAALIWPLVTDANHNGFTNDDVAARLLTTTDRTPQTGTTSRFGAVNLCQALAGPGVQACPAASPVPAAPAPVVSAPAPGPAPRIPAAFRVPPGFSFAHLARNPQLMTFTIDASGRRLVRVQGRVTLRCQRGFRYAIQLVALSSRDPQPLGPDGRFRLERFRSPDRTIGETRLVVSGRFSPDGSASGSLSASAMRRRGRGRCSTGTLAWAAPARTGR
jgi:hypothetical protein